MYMDTVLNEEDDKKDYNYEEYWDELLTQEQWEDFYTPDPLTHLPKSEDLHSKNYWVVRDIWELMWTIVCLCGIISFTILIGAGIEYLRTGNYPIITTAYDVARDKHLNRMANEEMIDFVSEKDHEIFSLKRQNKIFMEKLCVYGIKIPTFYQQLLHPQIQTAVDSAYCEKMDNGECE